MSMDLAEALERCDAVVAAGERGSPALSRKEQEALAVVLAAARENHASRLVAQVNATAAKALELTKPHAFVASKDPDNAGLDICVECWNPRAHAIHQRPESP